MYNRYIAMKRRATKIAPFLLLGAIINIAIAWGCARWIIAPNNTGNPLASGYKMDERIRALQAPMGPDDFYKVWLARRIRKPGSTLVVVTIVGSPAPDATTLEDLLPPQCSLVDVLNREAESRAQGIEPGLFYWDARGWPCLSMASWWPWFQQSQWPSPQVVSGIQFNRPTTPYPWPYNIHDLRALPLHPLWPGFAINTVFYAAILWLLFAFPFALHRRRRIKRGLCAACGYDLRGSQNNLCPECGAAIAMPDGRKPTAESPQ